MARQGLSLDLLEVPHCHCEEVAFEDPTDPSHALSCATLFVIGDSARRNEMDFYENQTDITKQTSSNFLSSREATSPDGLLVGGDGGAVIAAAVVEVGQGHVGTQGTLLQRYALQLTGRESEKEGEFIRGKEGKWGGGGRQQLSLLATLSSAILCSPTLTSPSAALRSLSATRHSATFSFSCGGKAEGRRKKRDRDRESRKHDTLKNAGPKTR